MQSTALAKQQGNRQKAGKGKGDSQSLPGLVLRLPPSHFCFLALFTLLHHSRRANPGSFRRWGGRRWRVPIGGRIAIVRPARAPEPRAKAAWESCRWGLIIPSAADCRVSPRPATTCALGTRIRHLALRGVPSLTFNRLDSLVCIPGPHGGTSLASSPSANSGQPPSRFDFIGGFNHLRNAPC